MDPVCLVSFFSPPKPNPTCEHPPARRRPFAQPRSKVILDWTGLKGRYPFGHWLPDAICCAVGLSQEMEKWCWPAESLPCEAPSPAPSTLYGPHHWSSICRWNQAGSFDVWRRGLGRFLCPACSHLTMLRIQGPAQALGRNCYVLISCLHQLPCL